MLSKEKSSPQKEPPKKSPQKEPPFQAIPSPGKRMAYKKKKEQ